MFSIFSHVAPCMFLAPNKNATKIEKFKTEWMKEQDT